MEKKLFEKLKSDGRLIDNEIKKLEKTWESPQNILCQRGDNIDEAMTKFSDFIAPIKKIRNELMEDMGIRDNYLKDMDRFLMECDTACDHLKQSVDDIETLFSEYGYIKPDNSNIHDNSTDSDYENTMNANKYEINNDSILTPKQIESLTINDQSPILSISNCNNINGNLPKFIATPVIKSVASAMHAEFANKHN